jgi:hypothetical protein
MDPLMYGLGKSKYWFLIGEILVSKRAVQKSDSESTNISSENLEMHVIDLINLISDEVTEN